MNLNNLDLTKLKKDLKPFKHLLKTKYFIDSHTRLPYINISKENIKKRKSIVIMLTAGSHYEIVGKLMPGNKIIRDFDHKDTLIKTLRAYLYNPEKIHNNYPNLVPFLQKNKKLCSNSSLESSDDDKNLERCSKSSSEDSNEYKNKKLCSNSSSESSNDDKNLKRCSNSSSESSDDDKNLKRCSKSSSEDSDYEYIKYSKK